MSNLNRDNLLSFLKSERLRFPKCARTLNAIGYAFGASLADVDACVKAHPGTFNSYTGSGGLYVVPKPAFMG